MINNTQFIICYIASLFKTFFVILDMDKALLVDQVYCLSCKLSDEHK